MMGNIHSILSFMFTSEENNYINFLDSLIIKKEDKLEMYIYRK